jgi:hypothetical protein
MLFIAKFVITYSSHSDKERLLARYAFAHNQIARLACLCLAEVFRDEDVQHHGYYNGETNAAIPRDLIYVYLPVDGCRSISALSKLFEGCAEILLEYYGLDVLFEIVDELPFGCIYIHNEDYTPPEFL